MARTSTTVNSSHVLLVEGEGDRGFFEQVCFSLNLNPDIKVSLPKDYQMDFDEHLHNSKQGAINLLKDLLNDLIDEEAPTQRLAIIIDADYEREQGLGYEKTIQQVNKIAEDYGFSLAENQTHGLCFKHSDGIAEFGLWVMPDNQKDGMFEDFIKECVTTTEQSLFNHAVQVVQDIPNKKFKDHHYSKAEVATWLAWQKPPGHGLYCSVKDNLLDTNHALFQEMAQWLKKIFI
ncbi:MAG: hypothetical protein Q8R54_04350 [Methylobacter sp.]|nr:hypothetical protein [Methylobacter sp.]